MKRPARILVLFGNVPLLGQERGTIDVLDRLHKSGAEVLFLIRGEWTKDTIQAELTSRGLPWVIVPFYDTLRKGHGPWIWFRNLAGILGGSWQMLRWHRRFKPTHIHAPHVSNVINFIPALCLVRTPLVYRAGDDMTLHHWLWKCVWRFTIWRTTRFAAISRFIVGRLLANGVPERKIHLVSNIAPARVLYEPWGDETRVSRMPDKCTFIYVGQLTHQKGVDVLVSAAILHCSQSETCRFIIAGDFSWKNELATSLRQEVEVRGFSERIVFTGYTRHVHELLAECDVHVCTSVGAEAYGNVVIEAKQEGLPSIIFPTGGLAELVEHGMDGWVCKENTVAELVTAFGFYENNLDVTRQQGIAAKASLPKLGCEKFDTDWQEIYEHGAT